MAQYRKRPVIIEAVEYRGTNIIEIEVFVGGHANWLDGELTVATLGGPLHASRGDWIVKGVAGEFYPVKPDIFAQTYEPVEDAP